MPLSQLAGTESCKIVSFFRLMDIRKKKKKKKKSRKRKKKKEKYSGYKQISPHSHIPGICHAMALKLSRHCREPAVDWDLSTRLVLKMRELGGGRAGYRIK